MQLRTLGAELFAFFGFSIGEFANTRFRPVN
jgi:hypothetical protein